MAIGKKKTSRPLPPVAQRLLILLIFLINNVESVGRVLMRAEGVC